MYWISSISSTETTSNTSLQCGSDRSHLLLRQLKTPTVWSTVILQSESAHVSTNAGLVKRRRTSKEDEFVWNHMKLDWFILFERVGLGLRGVFCCNGRGKTVPGWGIWRSLASRYRHGHSPLGEIPSQTSHVGIRWITNKAGWIAYLGVSTNLKLLVETRADSEFGELRSLDGFRPGQGIWWFVGTPMTRPLAICDVGFSKPTGIDMVCLKPWIPSTTEYIIYTAAHAPSPGKKQSIHFLSLSCLLCLPSIVCHSWFYYYY